MQPLCGFGDQGGALPGGMPDRGKQTFASRGAWQVHHPEAKLTCVFV